MNDDDKVIDLSAERDKRIHDVHEKRLQEVRKAFEQVLPSPVICGVRPHSPSCET